MAGKPGPLPKLTQQTQNDPRGALKTVRLSLVFLGGLGMLFGLMIYFSAPLLVRFVLGHAFQDTVPALRVFALWIPLCALTTVAIFQLLLPNHLDKQFNIVNFSAAILGIVGALFLAPRFGAVGIAWSAVISQFYTLVAFAVVLGRAGLNPFASSAAIARKMPAAQADGPSQEVELLLHERLSEAEPHSP